MAFWLWRARGLKPPHQGLWLRAALGAKRFRIPRLRSLATAYAIATIMLAVFSCAVAVALPPGIRFPQAQVHPLPPSLEKWHDREDSGNYFEAIKRLDVGYLIWSEFPVQVYLDFDSPDRPWVEAVTQAIEQWQAYFPLEISDRPNLAHITIHRQRPPLKLGPDGELGRVRSATTEYQLYLGSRGHLPDRQYLLHHCHIFLTPDQTPEYTLATARHELGHAIGIWGHSPEPTDALYFAQVRHPPPISPRDLNTLKRIYQQPTHLGWPMQPEHSRLWNTLPTLPTLPPLPGLPQLPQLPKLPKLPELPKLPKLPELF
ncbi:peptidase [Roseofilum sp. BLCC_M91]|uniref:Peptidase n=1 Tax=Roseofilum halophilum BLCC-M91 TaxID=3022259 RepID=A0ABT7BI65_9CYAN|nr:hypothetical protein [Roseofilum halophilum]MDJ1178874.1 peptidase [Roseofilum halophilum BLCC-M91]